NRDAQTVYAVAQQNFKQIGIDATPTQSAGGDAQGDALFSGVAGSSVPVSPLISWTNRWHSRQIANAANRFAGTNLEGYSNPTTDQAIVSLERALRPADQL